MAGITLSEAIQTIQTLIKELQANTIATNALKEVLEKAQLPDPKPAPIPEPTPEPQPEEKPIEADYDLPDILHPAQEYIRNNKAFDMDEFTKLYPDYVKLDIYEFYRDNPGKDNFTYLNRGSQKTLIFASEPVEHAKINLYCDVGSQDNTGHIVFANIRVKTGKGQRYHGFEVVDMRMNRAVNENRSQGDIPGAFKGVISITNCSTEGQGLDDCVQIGAGLAHTVEIVDCQLNDCGTYDDGHADQIQMVRGYENLVILRTVALNGTYQGLFLGNDRVTGTKCYPVGHLYVIDSHFSGNYSNFMLGFYVVPSKGNCSYTFHNFEVWSDSGKYGAVKVFDEDCKSGNRAFKHEDGKIYLPEIDGIKVKGYMTKKRPK